MENDFDQASLREGGGPRSGGRSLREIAALSNLIAYALSSTRYRGSPLPEGALVWANTACWGGVYGEPTPRFFVHTLSIL